jgi:hypothetical protein
MRVPRVRFRVRTMMIVVAGVALLSGSERLQERRVRFSHLADDWASRAFDWRVNRGARCYRDELLGADGELKKEAVEWLDECCAHFDALERKYRYAASHPWLAVEPDPPTPEPSPSWWQSNQSPSPQVNL